MRAAKAVVQHSIACAEAEAATAANSRRHDEAHKTYGQLEGDFSQRANARVDRVRDAVNASAARLSAARVAVAETAGVREETSLELCQLRATVVFSRDESDASELEWEWEGDGTSEQEIRQELQLMVAGVAVAEAGFATCGATVQVERCCDF